MVIVKPLVKFLLLGFRQGDCLRFRSNRVPNIFHKLNALGGAQLRNFG